MRAHAVIRTDIWGDDDWRGLSAEAQHLYLLLLSHPTLSYCGVAEWRPGRLAAMTRGTTRGSVEEAARELRAAHFIVTDDDTEEVLIRSFIKHDGLMKQPKLVVAMTSAYAATASPQLRGVIAHEVQRLRDSRPDLKWDVRQLGTVLKATGIDARGLGYAQAFTPRVTPTVTPDVTPTVTPNRGHGLGLRPTPTPTPTNNQTSLFNDDPVEQTPKSSPYSAAFDEWWQHYPRKQSKGDAFKAWEVWRRKKQLPDLKAMIDAAQGYGRRMRDSDPQFIKLPAGWLRDRKWEDEDGSSAPANPEVEQRQNERARWLAERGVTLEEYERRKIETGWLESLKKIER